MFKLLDKYKYENQIKSMSIEELNIFSKEIREFLIEKVSKTGGHLASNLGIVELTISLYNVFDFKKDKIIWDVGHQAYVHKILTGRKDKFDTLRQYKGISGFPKACESQYDMFETGHSSTSISAALGMARARDIKGEKYNVVAVIGDGALTGGMALEALNDVGDRKTNIIIVLNDNQMSIAKNVGGLSTYLSKIRVEPKYNKFKEEFDNALKKIPNIGESMAKSVSKLKNGIKQLVVPGMFFEDIGIKYLGPIDGHNIKELSKVFSKAKHIKGPVLIHTITKKGKGYKFAEKNPDKFHGIGPFNCANGNINKSSNKTYSKAFGSEIIKLAEKNKNIVAITAAMRDGTGLREFSKKYPNRFFDTGIAEQHSVTLAAGMAKVGLKPIFAVYSTFLQRAYDQVLHDVCIQKLPVIFAIDRAGIVGEDGETHQGVFDLSYLSHMPNLTIMTPKCVCELKNMLKWSVEQNFPIALRYPRGGDNINLVPLKDFKVGKWEIIHKEGNIALIAAGKMVQHAELVREKLNSLGIKVSVVNACFVKPIDKSLIKNLVEEDFKIITIEDNVIRGGFGSTVLEYVNSLNKNTKVLNLGFKDEFIPHGSVNTLYNVYELDVDGIIKNIVKII
ncbi:1-deoxy-D-xylulose-5-phosphate synthase [Clostridium acetireducens DSM 10703]|jgi:1-deoxy-D-xylulose-5-phosphate synthase|uniref:1-deoxy-D-xylulose-5-phosphate synthase n=1 Tax=Clostridium acetireducens DSM 10703 TaxID=1121290 RepID=A0A1E8F242_9CLOT|nr:1-deoxy-D-xylulose-5-phosphate synthase [Clostridium acetireducens]OFI07602.1 1-deoxy-D-xylulose-5-phosphate synthase [Clostridium acetireducens DSM 10703]